MSVNPQHRNICDFDGAQVNIWAEVSKDGTNWQQWRPTDNHVAEEHPKNGTALRTLVRSYSRTITSAIATLPYEVAWVRVLSRDPLTRRVLSTTTTQWDFIERDFRRVESQCWIICDRPGDCERWRLERLTRKLEALMLPKADKVSTANARYGKGAVVACVAALALACGTLGYAMRDAGKAATPPVAAPSPSQRTIDVIKVELPDGKTVTVPVAAGEKETNRVITRVIQTAVREAAAHKGESKSKSKSTATPAPTRSAVPKGASSSAPTPAPSQTETEGTAKPSPTPEASKPPTAKTEPQKAPGIYLAAPLSAALDAVLPAPKPFAAPMLLAAAPSSLSLLSAHLGSVGTVTDQVSIKSGDTVALAATVAVPGSDPVAVAVAATPEVGSKDVTVSGAAVPTAEDADPTPKVVIESATKAETKGTALGVGLSAITAAVADAPVAQDSVLAPSSPAPSPAE
ncbi:hypothetical protein ACGFYT_29890 [Streptomyces sp. NPDC048208]|uniref:hypothetical protein n=1 Tax=Streptomyces sp. NPDC048208 TaxID=3365515 RepID=UPI0037102B52